MANRRRGEIAATIAGQSYTLCLTLGSLAELEDCYGVGDLSALGDHFGGGRLSARDLATVLRVGLAGGGCPVSADEIRAWPAACLPEMVAAAAQLLAATFGEPTANPPGPQDP